MYWGKQNTFYSYIFSSENLVDTRILLERELNVAKKNHTSKIQDFNIKILSALSSVF